MERQMAYSMIKTALNKGFRDMKESPRRGIRNLVDLGEYFAESEPGNKFFRWAQDELGNPASPYYNFVEAVVKNVDHDILSTFFINFGYNSLVYGAKKIQMAKLADGIHIPWLLMLDGGAGRPAWLPSLESIVVQGKELGIYSYYFGRHDMNSIKLILNMTEHEKECAFFLRVTNGDINDILIERVAAAQNIFVLLELEAGNQDLPEVAGALRHRKCLYGGILAIDDGTRDIHGILRNAVRAGINTLFLIGENEDAYPQGETRNSPYSRMYYRENMPVVALDCLKIAFYIDTCISGSSRLGFINGEGNFTHLKPGACIPSHRCNVSDWPLKEIFAAAAPDGELNSGT